MHAIVMFLMIYICVFFLWGILYFPKYAMTLDLPTPKYGTYIPVFLSMWFAMCVCPVLRDEGSTIYPTVWDKTKHRAKCDFGMRPVNQTPIDLSVNHLHIIILLYICVRSAKTQCKLVSIEEYRATVDD